MKRTLVLFTATLSLLLSFLVAPLAQAETDTVKVNAVIESIILSKQMVKMTHDPIEAWGWPKMKMKFSVAPEFDLKRLNEGQKVVATMKKKGKMAIVTSFE